MLNEHNFVYIYMQHMRAEYIYLYIYICVSVFLHDDRCASCMLRIDALKFKVSNGLCFPLIDLLAAAAAAAATPKQSELMRCALPLLHCSIRMLNLYARSSH